MKLQSASLRENTFRQGVARYLTRGLSEVATGVHDSQRFVFDNRPREAVITGVLLPTRKAADDADVAYEEFLQRIRPSTMGMTFKIPEQCVGIRVVISACAFVRVFPEHAEQKAYTGRQYRTVFMRIPLEFRSAEFSVALLQEQRVLSATEEHVARGPSAVLQSRVIYPDFERSLEAEERGAVAPDPAVTSDGEWRQTIAALAARHSPAVPNITAEIELALSTSAAHEVSVTLANRSIDDSGSRIYDAGLYNATLEVQLLDGQGTTVAPVPYLLELPVHGYLYDRRQFVVGRNCNGIWDARSATLRSSAIPVTEQRRYLPDDDVAIRASELDAEPDSVVQRLRVLLDAMDRYLGSEQGWRGNETRLRREGRSADLNEFLAAKATFQAERDRFAAALDLLADKSMASLARAFRLTNRVMRRLWTDDGAWRAFQLVWIATLLPTVARREFPEHPQVRNQPGDDAVDVLWFPTGGGKTEAFFGLLLVQAFFDRLRGRERGTVAMLRFPLRLLTLQQYQRLLEVLVVAETVRREEGLGGTPFTLGMLIGKQGSPNTAKEAKEQADKLGLYRKVRDCPYCRTTNTIELEFDERRLFTLHKCRACKETLPVYIVDEDVFRVIPTFIVATVDKLALIGWNHRLGNVLGLLYGHDATAETAPCCPEHGFALKPGKDGQLRCEPSVGACSAELIDRKVKDPCPAFLVVDELHLLQEDLGTFDAHYETAAIGLMEKAPGGRPWKVIAATATIERYMEQVQALWSKPSIRFPGPGPAAGESFYARESVWDRDSATGEKAESPPRRVFVGVMPTVKTTINSAVMLLRAQYELISGLATIRLSRGAGAVVTAVGLDVSDAPDEDTITKVLDEFDCTLTYVLNRRAADQLAESIRTQLSEQLSRSGIPGMESRVLTSGTDTSEILDTMERVDRVDKTEPDPSKRVRSIVATSLVSHGVDLSRLNWMMFYGMPFLVAEYIQAGSRVGRRAVGIVVVVFAPNNERDRSVYHRFAEFHRHIDALVEPSAVERALPKAFERTVPGLLSALALQERTRQTNRPAYLAEEFTQLATADPQYSHELTAQRVLELVRISPDSRSAAADAVRRRTLYICEQIEMASLIGDAGAKRRQISEGAGWKAMTSLRDVDEEVRFEAVTDSIRVFAPVDEKLNASKGGIADEGEE